MEYLNKIGAAAKKASYELSALSTSKKNEALKLIAEELVKYIEYQIQEEPYTSSVIARGRVRVLPPDYRF